MNYSKEEVLILMERAFNSGFSKADIVEAGLESKQADIEVKWILLKHNKNKPKKIIFEKIEEYCNHCENEEDFIDFNLIKNCSHVFCKGQTEDFQCSVYKNKTVKKTIEIIDS